MHGDLMIQQAHSGSSELHEPARLPLPNADRKRGSTARGAPREKRTVPSMVRFTPGEWRAVEERARVCGRAPAVYIREAAIGAVPKARRVPEHADLIRELARLGNTLSALVAAVRSDGNECLVDDADAVLTEVLDAVRRVG